MDTPPVIDTTPAAPTNTLPSQLGFWGIHCSLTALPSFLIALTTFHNAPAVAGMLCGIATFVFAYAFITSTSLYGKVHGGLIGRSIKLGTRIRMIISLASLPLLIPIISMDMNSSWNPPTSLFYAPDAWFGGVALMLSTSIINIVTKGGVRRFNPTDNLDHSFLHPYLTTVIEGVLISISLVCIAFITLIILNYRRNRQQLPSQHFPQGPPV